MKNKSPHPLAVLLITFTLLVLMHGFTTPLFEAPDEVWHYAYARWLAEGHGLPSMLDNASGANQEVAQPPLYYGIAALLSTPFGDDDLDALFWSNPNFGYQSPGTVPDNKNMLIHTELERWPWQGAVLAVHMARLASLIFGLLTVAAAYGLGYETFQSRRGALVTAALLALHPQFIFISSVVNNDSAAAACSTGALWLAARILRQGLSPRRVVVLGGMTGLAILSKNSPLPMLPLAGVIVCVQTWREGTNWRKVVSHLALYGGAALLVGGWWYGRNWWLYGSPMGISQHTNTLWGRPEPITLLELLPELPLLLHSFWAAYGWGHVMWPDAVYWLLSLGSLYFLLRGILYTVQNFKKAIHPINKDNAHQSQLAIIGLSMVWLGGITVALLYWMLQVEAPHGRLLFPVIGAWALLLATGMQTRVSKDRQFIRSWHGDRIWLTVLLIISVLAPGTRILATFAPPRLYEPQAIELDLNPAMLNYSTEARLLGVSVNQERVSPGEIISIRACWEALQPMEKDYSVFVHLIGPGNSRVAERHTYPGLGRFPTQLWPVGQAFCDTYRLEVEEWATAPLRYNLEVGLFEAGSGKRLPATTEAGVPIEPPIVGSVVVAEDEVSDPQAPTIAVLGQNIALRGYDYDSTIKPGETVTVTLHWEALEAPGETYTAFIHLWEPGATETLAQHDSPPCEGWYPTELWQPGDKVEDVHTLYIPPETAPGSYPLWAGMYRTADGVRLPVEGEDGTRYDYDLVQLGELLVRE